VPLCYSWCVVGGLARAFPFVWSSEAAGSFFLAGPRGGGGSFVVTLKQESLAGGKVRRLSRPGDKASNKEKGRKRVGISGMVWT